MNSDLTFITPVVEPQKALFTTGQANEKNQIKQHSNILQNVGMSEKPPGACPPLAEVAGLGEN